MEKDKKTSSKLLATVAAVVLFAVMVGVFVESHGGNLWVYGVIIMTPLLSILFFAIDRLEKKNTAQQTQIDDLKRELEEVKGKMKE